MIKTNHRTLSWTENRIKDAAIWQLECGIQERKNCIQLIQKYGKYKSKENTILHHENIILLLEDELKRKQHVITLELSLSI